MMTLFKYLRRVIYVCFALALSGYFIATTQKGTQLIYSVVTTVLPINIVEINGTLASGLKIKKFTYHDHDVQVAIDAANLQINLFALLDFRLHVTHLVTENIIINVKTDNSTTNTTSLKDYLVLPAWLKHIDFDDLSISKLAYLQDRLQPILLDKATLQKNQHTYQFMVNANVGKLEGLFNFADKNWRMSWNIQIPDIGKIIPDCKGTLNSNGQLNNKNHTDSRITVTGFKYDDITLNKVNVVLTSDTTNGTLHAIVHGNLDLLGQLTGFVTLPALAHSSYQNQLIMSNLHFALPDIQTFHFKIPEVTRLSGKLIADIDMRGKLASPDFSAMATLQNGQADIPTTGMKIRNVTATASYKPNQPIMLKGQLTAGAGNASINGKLSFSENDYDLTLALNGQHLQIANTHEYQIVASPDLTLRYTPLGTKIAGNIFIPEASITPIDFNNVVTLPDETKFVHAKKSDSSFYRDLVLDVNGSLGNKINIKYDNLETRLNGKLHIIKERGSPITAIGALDTQKGYYNAYGNKLKITSGRIIYTGNLLTNPGIDIRASKKIKLYQSNVENNFGNTSSAPAYFENETIKVGIMVRGTAENPVLTFFSEPAGISQTDMISYLLFGYPRSQISSASSLALLSSVTSSMNPYHQSSGKVTERIEKTFGLNELGVSNTEYFNPEENKTGNTTTVNIGKKLGKNLSIHYSIGLFYPVSILNLRYKINRHLMLQTETSSVENGADLVYSLERK